MPGSPKAIYGDKLSHPLARRAWRMMLHARWRNPQTYSPFSFAEALCDNCGRQFFDDFGDENYGDDRIAPSPSGMNRPEVIFELPENIAAMRREFPHIQVRPFCYECSPKQKPEKAPGPSWLLAEMMIYSCVKAIAEGFAKQGLEPKYPRYHQGKKPCRPRQNPEIIAEEISRACLATPVNGGAAARAIALQIGC